LTEEIFGVYIHCMNNHKLNKKFGEGVFG
jgi:hypothetical protein